MYFSTCTLHIPNSAPRPPRLGMSKFRGTPVTPTNQPHVALLKSTGLEPDQTRRIMVSNRRRKSWQTGEERWTVLADQGNISCPFAESNGCGRCTRPNSDHQSFYDSSTRSPGLHVLERDPPRFKMVSHTILYLSLLAQLASAHFELKYPQWRGDAFIPPASEYIFACGCCSCLFRTLCSTEKY
jgi:hypothetical protein